MAENAKIDLLAIDTDRIPSGLIPNFETTTLLTGTTFERTCDIGLKRNLGLLLSRLIGWERIIFLDDDISVPDHEDLRNAASLLGDYTTVGLSNHGYPDNSAVCHAYRETKGLQDTFVGGGALAVACSDVASFFPNYTTRIGSSSLTRSQPEEQV